MSQRKSIYLNNARLEYLEDQLKVLDNVDSIGQLLCHYIDDKMYSSGNVYADNNSSRADPGLLSLIAKDVLVSKNINLKNASILFQLYDLITILTKSGLFDKSHLSEKLLKQVKNHFNNIQNPKNEYIRKLSNNE